VAGSELGCLYLKAAGGTPTSKQRFHESASLYESQMHQRPQTQNNKESTSLAQSQDSDYIGTNNIAPILYSTVSGINHPKTLKLRLTASTPPEPRLLIAPRANLLASPLLATGHSSHP
jgi:hypothetical protein